MSCELPLELVNKILMMRGKHPIAELIEDEIWEWHLFHERRCDDHRETYYEWSIEEIGKYEYPPQIPFYSYVCRGDHYLYHVYTLYGSP